MAAWALLAACGVPPGGPSAREQPPPGPRGGHGAPAVALETLLAEMTDRDAVARFPEPAFRSLQASSYDRRALAPDRPGWFANMDRSWFVRVDERAGRREHVMLDAAGPGAIVRFWGTWHGPRGDGGREPFSDGTVRFYLDGSNEPAIEGPISQVLSGGWLAPPPLSQFVAPDCPPENRAHNLFLPIPFADGCRVTYETTAAIDDGAYEGEALYYQIGYRSYPPGTAVESFSRGRLEAAAQQMDRAARALAGRAFDEDLVTRSLELPVTVPPGATRSLELAGPGAVRRIRARLSAEDEAQALRSTVLEVEFDGERAVWCPLDAFFGCGYLAHSYSAWYTERAEDGTMEARWVMPFERRMRLTLHNLGEAEVRLSGRIDAGPWAWDERSMHFRADWRTYAGVDAPGAVWDADGCSDLEFLSARGRGVLVADALAVFNTVDAWWGEGRREAVGRRRGLSLDLRHGHGGLLRLRLVPARALQLAVPRAADRRGQLPPGLHGQPPTAPARHGAVHADPALRHGARTLGGQHDRLHAGGVLVRAAWGRR